MKCAWVWSSGLFGRKRGVEGRVMRRELRVLPSAESCHQFRGGSLAQSHDDRKVQARLSRVYPELIEYLRYLYFDLSCPTNPPLDLICSE